MRSAAALARVAHPFPSLLNAVATGAIALLAGADPVLALRLGLGMLAIQVSIGALNDVADVHLDARQKPWKPIPAGLVRRPVAAVLALVGAAVAIAVSAMLGPGVVGVAVACLGLGYAYDLRLSRTALSWLPLSLALPLVPIYAWLGATGDIPPQLLPLVPAAVLAGAGLAIGNGLADIDRDTAVDRRTAVVALGRRRAWLVHGLALGGASAVALLAALLATPTLPDDLRVDVLQVVRLAGFAIGVGAIGLGVLLQTGADAARRERGWELEAIGVGSMGVGWLAGIAAVARLTIAP